MGYPKWSTRSAKVNKITYLPGTSRMPVETRTINVRPSSLERVWFSPYPGKDQAVPQFYLDEGPISADFIVEAFDSLYEKYTPNSQGSHNVWKDFQHYKRAGELPNTSMPVRQWTTFWNGSSDGSPYGWWGHLGYHLDRACGFRGYGGLSNPTEGLTALDATPDAEGWFIPKPADWERLIQQALSSMMPSIKQEVSILNSIHELKDFASLKHSFRDALSLTVALKAIRQKNLAGKLFTRIYKIEILREVLRNTSSGYLQWSFNIAPLIRDVKGLIAALRTVERRLNALITSAAKTQRKHYIVPLSELRDSDETTAMTGLGYPQWGRTAASKSRRLVYSEPSKFHVMIEYNYNYTQFQLEHARVLSYLDAIGVNLNPAILWNATKWSFVVDWIISVGRWLDQFKVVNMKPVVNIRRALWSVSRRRRIICTYDLYGDYPPSYDQSNCPASVVHETAYRRQVFTPTTSSLLASGLTLKEFSLGAALVTSRKRRHKR